MSLESKVPSKDDQYEVFELIDPWAKKITDLAYFIRENIVFSGEELPHDREIALFKFEEGQKTLRQQLLAELEGTEQKQVVLERFEKLCSGWKRLIEQEFRVEMNQAPEDLYGMPDYFRNIQGPALRLQEKRSLGLASEQTSNITNWPTSKLPR